MGSHTLETDLYYSHSYISFGKGQNLFLRTIMPKRNASHIVSIVHGLGEHSGRYVTFGSYLATNQIGVYTLDLPGHGMSYGKRGHIKSFNELIEAVDMCIDKATQESNNTPILLGHSLGGVIASIYALKYENKLKALVLSAPAFRIRVKVPTYLRLIAVVTSHLAPALTLSNNIDPGALSHDPNIAKAYTSDPLVHDRISLRLYNEWMRASEVAISSAHNLSLPILLIQGDEDLLVDPSGGKLFYERCSSKLKDAKVYASMFHEPLNEVDKQQVYLDILTWIKNL